MWPKSNPFTNAKSVAQPHLIVLASSAGVRDVIRLLNLFICMSLHRVFPVVMKEPFLSVQNYLPLSQSGFLDLARGTLSLTESSGEVLFQGL